jgi:hypothetical protein
LYDFKGSGGEKCDAEGIGGGADDDDDDDDDDDGGGGGGGCDVFGVRSEGGGGEHIFGHVTQSVMQKRPLEFDGVSTLSSEVTVVNKASPMKPTFEIQENMLLFMNSKLLLSLIIWNELVPS